MKGYLQSFIVGSSLPVSLMFYFLFFSVPQNKKAYTNEQYAMVAPLYFGFMNMLSLFIGNFLGLQLKGRLLITSIISIIYVLSLVRLNSIYKFTDLQWVVYALTIIVFHLMTYNVIIYGIESGLEE